MNNTELWQTEYSNNMSKRETMNMCVASSSDSLDPLDSYSIQYD